jgi:hypothetical protein
MRNRINASDINVVVDRNDRAVVAGIRVLHGMLPATSGASYPRAGACATTPGHKNLGRTGSCRLLGKRLHREHQQMSTMQERLPQSWRSRRSFTTSSRRLASFA